MKRKLIASVLALCMCVSLAACSGGGGAVKEDTIKIYEGQFSEMYIIHYMVKLLVEEHTDLKVQIMDEMAPAQCFNELVSGNCDLMNSYDGTLLTTFLHLDASNVPEGTSLYDFTNEEASKQKSVRLLGKLGTNNTYAIAVPQAVADAYNLETVSDLAACAPELVFGAEHDFFTEEGSAKFNPFTEFYGLNFKEAKQIDMALKYAAVESGNIDVTVAYATDGRNREAGLKILADDREFFPEYNGAVLVRDDLFERFKDTAPNLEEVLEMLTGIFTDEDMVDLTYQVDIEGKSVADVSSAYLKALGLIG